MNDFSRRDFLTKVLTGVVVAGATGKVMGQIIPRIIETQNPNIIQAEFVIDLTSATYTALKTVYSSMSIRNTGVSVNQIIVMRTPNDIFVALENRCTHENQLLGKFSTTSKVFTCSLHSSQFDENGICKLGPSGGPATLDPLTTYPVTYDKANEKLYLNRITDVRELLADAFMIRCYPNPASTDTLFEFALEKEGITTLELFDERGVLVSTIFRELRPAGTQQVVFNVNALANGSYSYRIRTNDGFETIRTLTVVH